jgi:hypothetical protein
MQDCSMSGNLAPAAVIDAAPPETQCALLHQLDPGHSLSFAFNHCLPRLQPVGAVQDDVAPACWNLPATAALPHSCTSWNLGISLKLWVQPLPC